MHEALSQLRVHEALSQLRVHEALSLLLVHEALSLLRLWQRGALSSQRRAVLHAGCICTLVLVKQVN